MVSSLLTEGEVIEVIVQALALVVAVTNRRLVTIYDEFGAVSSILGHAISAVFLKPKAGGEYLVEIACEGETRPTEGCGLRSGRSPRYGSGIDSPLTRAPGFFYR